MAPSFRPANRRWSAGRRRRASSLRTRGRRRERRGLRATPVHLTREAVRMHHCLRLPEVPDEWHQNAGASGSIGCTATPGCARTGVAASTRSSRAAPGHGCVVVVLGEDRAEASLVEDVVPLGRRNARVDGHSDPAGPDRCRGRRPTQSKPSGNLIATRSPGPMPRAGHTAARAQPSRNSPWLSCCVAADQRGALRVVAIEQQLAALIVRRRHSPGGAAAGRSATARACRRASARTRSPAAACSSSSAASSRYSHWSAESVCVDRACSAKKRPRAAPSRWRCETGCRILRPVSTSPKIAARSTRNPGDGAGTSSGSGARASPCARPPSARSG